jgi:hypothetical protein
MKTHINLFREYAEDLFNIEDLSELSKLDQTKKRFFFSYSRYISELKMLIVAREGFMKVLRID